jgi:O-acetylhomoserine/O-acetylserine sulfhydrylase-like pyridoxal-dependent enzyme
MSDQPDNPRKPGAATQVAHLGRDPARHLGAINTPVYRASTILFDSVADYEASQRGQSKSLNYGLRGLPTVTDLQAAFASLEGGHAALAVPSGLAATTLPLLALTSAGDHVVVTDSVYGPTRRFCDNHLTRLGVEVSYYDPLVGAGIESAMRPNTRVVFAESPGSQSTLLVALERLLAPPSSIVLAGDAAQTRAWQRSLEREFRPDVAVIDIAATDAPPAVRKGEPPREGAAAWLCKGLHCLPPMTTYEAIAAALAAP